MSHIYYVYETKVSKKKQSKEEDMKMKTYMETHHNVTIRCSGMNATDDNVESIIERFNEILDAQY